MKNYRKRIPAILLCLCMILTLIPSAIAAESIEQKINGLRKRFPDGKFWNHYVSDPSEAELLYSDSWDESFSDSVTSHGCAPHYRDAEVGEYDCNFFDGGIQCWGFACKLFYEIFGVRASKMSKRYDTENVQVGDYLRLGYDSHSALCIGRDGDTLTIVECNWRPHSSPDEYDIILWDRTVSINSVYYYKHASNYDSFVSTSSGSQSGSSGSESGSSGSSGSNSSGSTGGLTSTPPPAVKVTFDPWSNDSYTYIKETDASIGQEVNVYNGKCTETGMYLYDQNGKYLAKGINDSYRIAKIYFMVNEECGIKLTPGTTYKYRFYAIVNGETYWGDYGTFTTKNSKARGDIDSDGYVGNSDLILLCRYVVNALDKASVIKVEKYGDLNDDGKVNNQDIIIMARVVVGM